MNQISDSASDLTAGTIKLIGVGQSLRGDDAAGLAAVRLWQEIYDSNAAHPIVQVELVEVPGVGLLNLIEGFRLVILVDAVHSGAKAGTIQQLSADQLKSFSEGSGSAHGWGVADTLALGQALRSAAMPDEMVVIGIEAGGLSLGEPLSPEVERALPEVARLIEELIQANELTR